MKKIKDLITVKKPVLIFVDSIVAGKQERKIIDLCPDAKSMLTSLNNYFNNRLVKAKLSNFTIETFEFRLSQNYLIPGEFYLDYEVQDGKLEELLKVLMMTVEDLAKVSESEQNFASYSKNIEKDSVKFTEYYDPSILIKIIFEPIRSTDGKPLIITCEQIAFNKEQHDSEVLKKIEDNHGYIGED